MCALSCAQMSLDPAQLLPCISSSFSSAERVCKEALGAELILFTATSSRSPLGSATLSKLFQSLWNLATP